MSKLFPKLLKLTLEIGNFLNASQAQGFQLDFLSKLSWVKDTVTKKTLLYHIIKVNDPQVEIVNDKLFVLPGTSR